MTIAEKKLLKKCLGDSDFDTSNNVEVYNWDYGNMYYPHIIKLVRTVTSQNDGGYYAAIWFDADTLWDQSGYTGTPASRERGTFRLVNPMYQMDQQNIFDGDVDPAPDWFGENTTETFNRPKGKDNFFGQDDYDVYTTKATLALTSNMSEVTFGLATKNFYTVNPTYDKGVSNNGSDAHVWREYDGDISCEIGQNNADKMKYIFHCLNKTDMFTVLNWGEPRQNPAHINLYTATRLFTAPSSWAVEDKMNLMGDLKVKDRNAWLTDPGGVAAGNAEVHEPGTDTLAHPHHNPYYAARRLHGNEYDDLSYMTHVVNSDISSNWAAASTWDQVTSPFWLYKFFPARESTYNYVGECSNRGICQADSGLCKCFPGYTNDDCSVQDSIAM